MKIVDFKPGMFVYYPYYDQYFEVMGIPFFSLGARGYIVELKPEKGDNIYVNILFLKLEKSDPRIIWYKNGKLCY